MIGSRIRPVCVDAKGSVDDVAMFRVGGVCGVAGDLVAGRALRGGVSVSYFAAHQRVAGADGR
jgi:hypothetical protein